LILREAPGEDTIEIQRHVPEQRGPAAIACRPAPSSTLAREKTLLQFQGRDILEKLPEIINLKWTVIMVYYMHNNNTHPEGAYAKDGRRIDVDYLIGPVARFIDTAAASGARHVHAVYEP